VKRILDSLALAAAVGAIVAMIVAWEYATRRPRD